MLIVMTQILQLPIMLGVITPRHDHRLDHGSMLQCLYGGHYICVSLMKGNVHMYMCPGAWCQSWAGTWHREHKQCATEE